jgi:exopolysaccharide biosynthesis polyprenyl glycosylphosphotransferase
MTKRFSLGFSLFLLASDIVLVTAALVLATWARIALPYGLYAPGEYLILPLPVYLLTPLLWVVIFILSNVYDPRHTLRLITEIQTIIQAWLFGWLTEAGLLYLTYRYISRLEVVYFAAFSLALIVAHRAVLRVFFMLIGGRTSDARRVLVVGTGPIAHDVSQMVRSHAWAGLSLAGFVTGNGSTDPADSALTPILGTIDETAGIVETQQINEVLIALPSEAQVDMRNLVHELQWQPVNIRIVPDYFDLAFLHVQVEDFGGMPLLTLKEPSLTPFQRVVKRAFDLIVTGAGLIVALPAMAVIALAIRADSPGPVIFKQERIGEGGRPFVMHKFRTMVAGAERLQDEVITYDDQGNILHKHADDPRITRVGRFLRRTSLDELPNIYNILRGEMSLVGPRPEMPWLVEKYKPWQRKRFEVPQGMTGWWQISGRADKPMHLHTEEDLFYIRNYSLWLDIQILWRTVAAVLLRRGAY